MSESNFPSDWHDEKKGKYSAFGSIPKIEGGEFIVGKFEDTLPDFFSKENFPFSRGKYLNIFNTKIWFQRLSFIGELLLYFCSTRDMLAD